MGALSLENKEVKKNWWKYLPLLHSLSIHISKNPRTKGLRSFTILPLYSFQQRNINIDTEALYQLWASTKHNDVVKRGIFKENFDYWWNRSFNIRKVSTRNRTFTYYIQTNGISTSVHLQKPKGIDSNDENDSDDDSGDEYEQLDLEGRRVIGVDPGRRDLFVAVDQNENVIKCSTKEYYEVAGFRKARKKREVWMNNNKYMQAIVRGKYLKLIDCTFEHHY